MASSSIGIKGVGVGAGGRGFGHPSAVVRPSANGPDYKSVSPKVMAKPSVVTIDVFSGSGGLSLGAHYAGTEVRVALDNDPHAIETIRSNPMHLTPTTLAVDVSSVSGSHLRRLAQLERRDRLIVVGGPPCQPFSKAGYWTYPGEESRYRKARDHGVALPRPAPPGARPDGRRTLVQEFWRIVVEAKADAFVFENVPSILHPQNKAVLDELIDSALKCGYENVVVRANAVTFGVPQRRERVFLIGSKWHKPIPPQPTHADRPVRSGSLKAAKTAGVALAPISDDGYRESGELVTGRWAEALRQIPPGWNYKFLTAWAGHPAPMFEAERRFWNFLLKLSPDLPSWTIPANPGPWVGPFHWANRRLRTVELAALQGFPIGYRFSGDRRDKIRLIGNAVPPLLAKPMVAAAADTLGIT